MELRRGKGNLERLVRQWKEDEDNKKWVESKTTPCPTCGVRVEKRCIHVLRPMRGLLLILLQLWV